MVVATAFLLPLFLSLVYVARYVDIKQTTVQASRYVAWERAIDPETKRRKDSDLANEVRTRFFASGNRMGGGFNSVNYVAGTPGNDEYNSFWLDQSGKKRLVNSFTDVTVSTRNSRTPGAVNGFVESGEAALLGLGSRTKGFFSADVEATLQNVSGFDPLAAINLRIGASTAILGDSWGASGAEDVKSHIKPTVPASFAEGAINTFAWFLIPFESSFSDFYFGCIAPDVVPKDRLQPYRANGYCRD